MSFSQDVSKNDSFSTPSSVAVRRSLPRGRRDLFPPELLLNQEFVGYTGGMASEKPGNIPFFILSLEDLEGNVGAYIKVVILFSLEFANISKGSVVSSRDMISELWIHFWTWSCSYCEF